MIKPTVDGPIPMILQVRKADLVDLINQELNRSFQKPIPLDAEVTIRVPPGAEYYGGDTLNVETIDIRYKRKDYEDGVE